MTRSRMTLAAGIFGVLLLSMQPGFASADPSCTHLQMYYPIGLEQSNGWGVTLNSPTRAFTCYPSRTCKGGDMGGNVTVISMTPQNVKFITTWDNGSAGIYTGALDDDGFVKGITQDKWHPESKADWHFDNVMDCY